MLEMYKLTRDGRYLNVFLKTFKFVEQYQIASPKDGGGWWAARNADGSLGDNISRTSTWHGAYHNGRAMLRCRDLLNELAVEKSDE